MANDTYLQVVDRPKEYFVGKPLFEVLPEVRSAVEPLLNDVYWKGIPYYGTEFEVVLNRHGKKELAYFNFVYHPLREENVITGVVVVASDVTEQVRRKQFLQESEQKFRLFIDQSPIAMSVFRGKDYIIELANKTLLEKIWRRDAESVIGKRLLDVFPELVGQPFPALLEEVLRTGKTHSEKEALAYVEGSDGMRSFFLDFDYSALYNQEGIADGIMVTVSDVTDRVRSRKQVEEAEERARLAAEASLSGIFDVDLVSDRITCSQRFYEIFELPAGSSHTAVLERVHPDDLVIRNEAQDLAFATGVLFYEVRIVTPHGIRWIRTQGRAFKHENGEPTRLLGTIVDITDKVMADQAMKTFTEELEKKVQERTRELQVANEELGIRNQELMSFNYISSHDLQEPLRKIQTFASRIKSTEEHLSPENQVYFQKMQQSAKRMQLLIRDLLEYSRAGEGEKSFESVDVGEIVQTIRQHIMDGSDVGHLRIEVGALPVVMGIPFQMNQLFSNLLSNAVKFSRKVEYPLVRVEHEVADGFHVIRVTDNGIGFLPEYKEHIFEVFKRLHHKSEYEGTGIGLAICKKIVENHRGMITADSVPGEGAEFTVWLPV
jgi:PAS domain S-box-containing protein